MFARANNRFNSNFYLVAACVVRRKFSCGRMIDSKGLLGFNWEENYLFSLKFFLRNTISEAYQTGRKVQQAPRRWREAKLTTYDARYNIIASPFE